LDFKHIILTAFNVGLYDRKKVGRRTIKAWFDHRVVVFKKYTLASIMNQTNKNFIWEILFDTDTPKEHQDIIEELYKIDNVSIRFTSKKKSREEKVNERGIAMRKLVGTSSNIITTRIDNDDAFNINAIEYIQDQFKKCDPSIDNSVNFLTGLIVVDKPKEKRIFKIGLSSNAFVSLMEPIKESTIKTVKHVKHTLIRCRSKIANIHRDKNMWIHFVHGHNVENSIAGREIYEVKESFGFDMGEFQK